MSLSPTAGWQTVEWESLIIPIPPQGKWEIFDPTGIHPNNTPVRATASVTYPSITGTVELPFGPSFIILQFAGSLDDWLDLERRNSPPGNPVQEETVRDLTLAGRPAKAYQHAVTGTGLTEQYVLKLTDDDLLLISSQDAPNETYRRVIDGLVIRK